MSVTFFAGWPRSIHSGGVPEKERKKRAKVEQRAGFGATAYLYLSIAITVYAHVVQFVPINRWIAPPDRALYSGSLIPPLLLLPNGAHPGSSSVRYSIWEHAIHTWAYENIVQPLLPVTCEKTSTYHYLCLWFSFNYILNLKVSHRMWKNEWGISYIISFSLGALSHFYSSALNEVFSENNIYK